MIQDQSPMLLWIAAALVPAAGLLEADLHVNIARTLHPVDRRIYGHHLEHFGRIIQGGLWAELLRNRKFYPIDPARTNVADPWQPELDRSGVSYAIDRSETIDGISSQRVSVFGAGPAWRGISQTGFDVLTSKEYVAYAWIRATPASREVSFRLEAADGKLAAHAEATLTQGEFRKYEVRLKPDRDLRPAVFRIAFNTQGQQWIGAASLMPADNVDGMRPDVLKLVEDLRPAILRWPGGGYPDSYDWRKAVGPRDRRPPQDILPFGQPNGYDHGMDPNDFGTDEFLRLCERLKAEPYITANFGTGTPEMAAQWVEYCNGRSKQHRVKYWSVGNETWGPFEPGYTTAAGYAAFFPLFAKAMRAVDPSIQLTAVGHFDTPDRKEWNEPVLAQAWRDMDMLSLHHYYPGGLFPQAQRKDRDTFYSAVVAEPTIVESGLREMIARADRITGGSKKLLLPLDEWNEWDWSFELPADRPDRSVVNQFIDEVNRTGLELNHTARDGVFGAGMLHTLLRVCDRVPIGIRTHIINSLGAIRTDSTRAFITASGKVMQLYSNHTGTRVVETKVKSPTFDVPQNGWKGISYLDAVGTYAPESGKLFLHLINRHPAQPVKLRISLGTTQVEAAGEAWQIAPGDFLAQNDFNATKVDIARLPIRSAAGAFDYELPKHSITILELQVRQ